MRPLVRRLLATIAGLLLVGAGLPAAAAVNDPGYDDQWALPKIGAPGAWSRADGAGIIIAVVDTGVDLNHEDLAAKLVEGRDFVDPDTPPDDEHGHGTHVAGIAAAITNNGRGIAGTAPQARIMPVRVLDEEGEGTASNVGAGIRWAADNGAHIINLSLGSLDQPLFGPSFAEDIRYAWSKGAIPVVAAGNMFITPSGYGDHPSLVVSATDPNDQSPEWSSGVGGAQWGMSAPGGGGVLSSRQDDILSALPGNRYGFQRGTSMAAPHVAGAAALLRSMGIGQQHTVEILLETAKQLGSYDRYGHGRLDADRATAAAAAALQPSGSETAPAPPPPPPSSDEEAPQPAPQPASEPDPDPTPDGTEAPPPQGDGDEAEPAPEEVEDPDPTPTGTPSVAVAGEGEEARGGGGGGWPWGPIAAVVLVAGIAAWLGLARLGRSDG